MKLVKVRENIISNYVEDGALLDEDYCRLLNLAST